jgi:hypothetical protein
MTDTPAGVHGCEGKGTTRRSSPGRVVHRIREIGWSVPVVFGGSNGTRTKRMGEKMKRIRKTFRQDYGMNGMRNPKSPGF